MDGALAVSMVVEGGSGSMGSGLPAGGGAPQLRLIGGDEARPERGAAQDGGGPGKRARRRDKRAGVIGGVGGRAGGEREWNAAVFLTAYPVPGAHGMDGPVTEFMAFSGTVATKDRADRAHQVRSHGTGLLACAAELEPTMSRPRRYPAHQMTSRGVAFDSAFDELHRRQMALDGIAGVGGRSGQFASSSASASELALRAAGYEAARRGVELRDLVRRRLNESSMGDSEAAAEAYAREQIERYKAGTWVADGGGK